MTTMDRLIRRGGAVLCAGAALSAVAAAAQDHVDLKTLNTPMTVVGTVSVVGGLLMLLGIPAWYVVQMDRAGRLGTLGFLLTFFGWAGLQVATQPVYTYLAPALYARPGNAELAVDGALEEVSTGFLAYVLGLLLMLNLGLLIFGIAMVRAKVFPRRLTWVVAVGPPAVFFLSAVEQGAIAVLLAAVAVCGFLMATGRVVAATGPETVIPVAAG